MNIYKILLVGAGGFAGSVARYLASRWLDEKIAGPFPYSTFAVNVLGSFLVGLVYGWLSGKGSGADNLRLLFATGFCGGFTTFSAFAYENVNLLDQKFFGTAGLYMIMSVAAALVAVAAGMVAGRNI